MMRVDVDFNERDRNGHVVTRVPSVQVSRLAVGQKVYLYDPPERLWADAVVARVNPETSIAAFDVDWDSVVDAEVARRPPPDPGVMMLPAGKRLRARPPAGLDWA